MTDPSTRLNELRTALKRKLASLNKSVWPCKTRWSDILLFSDDTRTFMLSAAVDESALLQRDAKCIELLGTLLGDQEEVETAVPFPLRAGQAACNGVEAYASYHAAWAVHIRLKQYDANNDDALLVSAYRQLAACGKWDHADALCPPQLRIDYKSVLMGLILCHLLLKGAAIETKTSEDRSEHVVQSLHFMQCTADKSVQTNITHLLAVATACHWVYYHTDPLGGSPLATDKESVATAAVVWFLETFPHLVDNAAMAKFKRINMITCDRSTIAAAMVEFRANHPMPQPAPAARAWALPYVKSVHATAAKGGRQVSASTLAVTASLVQPVFADNQ